MIWNWVWLGTRQFRGDQLSQPVGAAREFIGDQTQLWQLPANTRLGVLNTRFLRCSAAPADPELSFRNERGEDRQEVDFLSS